VIRSYQDLLPEPSDHGEIIRLEPPDYRPTTIVFSLGEVLGGEDPIELRPFDTIRIFGRYEIDPPKVSIYGEVLRPGRYPLAHNMTASDLVRMAGGFKRSAYTASADVTSYVVQNGARVRTKYETIAIGKAVAGDSSADLMLKPGDVVTIHQLSGWKEIGASVTVKGEVQYPGTYGIEEGEKLSSLLLRTHGFRADAYPEGAVLERLQVKELEERNRKELIQRIEAAAMTPKLGAGAEQAAMGQAMFLQRQQIVKNLKNQPASGRLVIRISSNIRQWQNTPADIELRSGDVLTIPRRPNFVMVSGQVYNASAITYAPGKNAHWYLHQAGGPTDLANRKDIYIIRANGSVIGREGSGSGWWKGNVLSTAVRPGDTIVVPEKIVGGGTFWKTALSSAQLISSLAIAGAAVASF
jgi:protein involved in polysaccharide export with SLBB domain